MDERIDRKSRRGSKDHPWIVRTRERIQTREPIVFERFLAFRLAVAFNSLKREIEGNGFREIARDG